MEFLQDLEVDDSYGYCKIISSKEASNKTWQEFKPITINKYKGSDPFDGTIYHLEYFYLKKDYEKVIILAENLYSTAGLKWSLRKELLELLIRSYTFLLNRKEALKNLRILLSNFKSEDPGREYLTIWTYEKLSMFPECIQACKDYLKIRPGDLSIIRIIVKCSKKLATIDLEEWEGMEEQIVKCYQRSTNI